MRKFNIGDTVHFNPKYLKLLDNYEEFQGYIEGWKSYMTVFSNHYGINSRQSLKNLGYNNFIIAAQHSINCGGIQFYYYSLKTPGEDMNILPNVFLPEFFSEYYKLDFLNYSHSEIVFKTSINNTLIENVDFGKSSIKEEPNYNKIKIPEFKLKAYKFKAFDNMGNINTKTGFKFYDNYALVLENGVFKKTEIYAYLSELSKEEIIKNFGKVKIKDYQKSADIFGYKPSKKEMFESGNLYSIDRILFDYESKKTNNILDVFELNNGTKSLKFVLEDLEFVFIEPKGFNIPTKINITNIKRKDVLGKTVRIINDKGLPIKKNDKAVLVEMWNTHQPLTGSRFERREVSWDKNTKIKIELDNKKTIICKFKNVKFVK